MSISRRAWRRTTQSALASRGPTLARVHRRPCPGVERTEGEHRRAESFVNRAKRDFTVYVAGLPGVGDLVDSLHQLAHRVGSEWRTTSHREAYVMARKGLLAREDLRVGKPLTYMDALRTDKK